jgi:hypothetical protein
MDENFSAKDIQDLLNLSYDPSKINIIMIPKSDAELNGAGYLNPFIK